MTVNSGALAVLDETVLFFRENATHGNQSFNAYSIKIDFEKADSKRLGVNLVDVSASCFIGAEA